MSIDVVYQGLPIAKEARVHFEEGGLFVEVDTPMPVATQLTLSHSDKTPTSTFTGRVRRIREGAAPSTTGTVAATPSNAPAAGMLIVPADAAEKLPRWLMALHPDTTAAAEFQPEPPPPEPVKVEPAKAEPEPAKVETKAEPEAKADAKTEAKADAKAEPASEATTEPAPSATSPEPAAEGETDEKKPAASHGAAKKKKTKRR